ncbi:MAG: Thiamine-precursor transporter protein (ThiW) [Candidatus Bathyarchaeota archaeon BA1]|nr:MAG: Thiamine-precursor transporter protein (ThiW) [Candidatus Bathyarchaeota archaeon BA1]
MKAEAVYIKKIALVSVFSGLGVIIAPFLWFPFLTTKAFPGQHMINALTGVLLGPLWAAIVALFIGIIRNMVGIGTIYAFPGGIPGGIVVGIVYWLFKKSKRTSKVAFMAAFCEPVGTVFIGATLALYLIAPWIGDIRLLSLLKEGPLIALLTLWSGWSLSSGSGSILGFLILLALNRAKISREILFGEK